MQCPKCLENGLLTGRRKPIETRPQSMLEAKELPRSHLSDNIEEHLQKAVLGVHILTFVRSHILLLSRCCGILDDDQMNHHIEEYLQKAMLGEHSLGS